MSLNVEIEHGRKVTECEKTPVPDWLFDRVLEGLQTLIALRLPGTPANDMMPATAAGWADAVWITGKVKDKALDEMRVVMAFRRLAADSEKWPAPKMLAPHLPPRLSAGPALPKPPLTEEQRQTNIQRVNALRDELWPKS